MCRRWVNFLSRSCKKCFILRKSMENRRYGQNVQLFRANHHVSAFGSTFSKKSAKRAPFRKRKEKLSIWPNCGTFSSKPPCLNVWVTFSGKTWKKCLISHESTRNLGNLAKILYFLEQTTMFRRLSELFNKKLQKVPDFAK